MDKIREIKIASSEFTPRITPEGYAHILRGLSMKRIALERCEASADFNTVNEAFDLPQPPPISISRRARFTLNDNVVDMHHAYIITAKLGKRKLFTIKAEYSLLFKTEQPFTEEFFEVFERLALPNYTWPFLRELVYSLTGRMDIPKFLLPLLQLP